MKSSIGNLKILYYDARSILPKFDELRLSADTLKSHFICIVETWLSKEVGNNELFIPGFQLFRLDRDHHGGGVLIYVADIFLVTALPPSPSLIELLCLSVRLNTFKLYLCLLYRPPSSPSCVFDEICTYFQFIDVGCSNLFF